MLRLDKHKILKENEEIVQVKMKERTIPIILLGNQGVTDVCSSECTSVRIGFRFGIVTRVLQYGRQQVK